MSPGDLESADRSALESFAHRAGEGDVFAMGPSLRTRADVLVAGGVDHDEAAALYREVIALARPRGAFIEEVAAAAGLARLHFARTGNVDAGAELEAVLGRVADGGHLPDVRSARATLAEIAKAGRRKAPTLVVRA